MEREEELSEAEGTLLGQRIRLAYQAVKSAGITEEALMLEAFRYALKFTTGDDQVVDPATVPSRSTRTTDRMPSDGGMSPSDIASKVSSALDMPRDVIELFYDIGDDEMTLNIPPKALPNSVSAAMREIAIVLSVGRKHAGIGNGGTAFELIRHACDEHGKLDKKNFAAAMTGLKPRLTVTGRGLERLLVPKKPADDMARDILFRYYQTVV